MICSLDPSLHSWAWHSLWGASRFCPAPLTGDRYAACCSGCHPNRLHHLQIDTRTTYCRRLFQLTIALPCREMLESAAFWDKQSALGYIASERASLKYMLIRWRVKIFQTTTESPFSLVTTSRWLWFVMFRHLAWAVGSFKISPPAAGTVWTRSTGGCYQGEWSPGMYLLSMYLTKTFAERVRLWSLSSRS